MELLRRYEDQIYAAMRIVVGFLFVSHGVQKVLLIIGGGDMPMAAATLYPAAVIESVGGALITLGLFTRWTAFICSGQMAVAYFMAHQPQGLLPIQNHGELAVVYCWLFLVFAVRGSGIWSIDDARS